MGHTNYLKNKPALTDAQWKALTADVKKLLKETTIPVGNGHGEKGSKPVFTKDAILFNGIGDDSHETAAVSKHATDFEFCKTAHKPYDSLVVEFYKLIRKHAPGTIISSD